jgi:hypothetical protein
MVFLLSVIQTSSGAYPDSSTMGTRELSPGGEGQLRHEADNSPPTIAEVKNAWIYISIPPYIFMT